MKHGVGLTGLLVMALAAGCLERMPATITPASIPSGAEAGAAPSPSATAVAPASLLEMPTVPFRSLSFFEAQPIPHRDRPQDAFTVIRSNAEWEAFLARNPHLLNEPLAKPQPIDFTRKQLVVAALAPQPKNDVLIEIAAIEQRPHDQLVHTIRWESQVEFEGGLCPFHVIEMDRTDQPVSFAPTVVAWGHERPCIAWPRMGPGLPSRHRVECDPVDGDRARARLVGPRNVAVNAQGEVYLADEGVRKVSPDGHVTTVATLPGKRPAITDLAFDSLGNLWVVDHGGYAIYRLPPGGALELVAGGTHGTRDGRGAEAQFAIPYTLAIGPADDLYITDRQAIRHVSPAGEVTAWIPEGRLHQPGGIAADGKGHVFVADGGRILRFTPQGTMTVFATSEPPSLTPDHQPSRYASVADLALDAKGHLYVADPSGHRIWIISPFGAMRVLAGSTAGYADGAGTEARFDTPLGLAVGPDGTVYVADWGNHRLRAIAPDGRVTTLAGHLDRRDTPSHAQPGDPPLARQKEAEPTAE